MEDYDNTVIMKDITVSDSSLCTNDEVRTMVAERLSVTTKTNQRLIEIESAATRHRERRYTVNSDPGVRAKDSTHTCRDLHDERQPIRSKTWEGFPNYHELPPNYQSECESNYSSADITSGDRDVCAGTILQENKLEIMNFASDDKEIADSNKTSTCPSCDIKRRNERRSLGKKRLGKTRIFMSVRFFVVCLSMLQLVQVMGSGYSKSALTSIERRYRLSTFSVGLLQSCFHVGNLSVILFVSYFGAKWNRPRAIAIGSLLMAISSFLSALPQFVGSRYMVDMNSNLAGSHPAISSSFYVSEMLKDILNDTTKPSPLSHDTINPDDSSSTDKNNDVMSGVKAVSVMSIVKAKAKVKLCTVSQPARQIIFDGEAKFDAQTGGTESHSSNLFTAGFESEYSVKRPGIDDNILQNGERVNKMQERRNETLGDKKNGEENETEEYWDDSSFYVFIAIGSVIKGMGHSPLHPLGMSFVDDFATKRNSAVYIGVVSALSLLGPAFGFILGSLTTGTWVDRGWVDVSKVEIGPHHPLWVGAWWMGYLVTASLLLLATIPFCMFPREIEKEKEDEEDEGACLLCFRKYYTQQSDRRISVEENHDDCECDLKIYAVRETIKDSLYGDKCDDSMLENEIQPLNDKLKAYENMLLEEKSLLNQHVERLESSEIVNSDCNIDNATRLISYLELTKEGENVKNFNVSTDCEKLIPFSVSEMQFRTTRTHSISPVDGNIPKSASVPIVYLDHHVSKGNPEVRGYRRNREGRHSSVKTSPSFEHSSSRRKSHLSRRASRLEKLALVDFTASLKGLLTDVVFLSITLAFVCLTSFLAASVTYVSKYMETQFSVTASFANLLNGSVNLPMAVVGNLLGGWLIRRFNLNVRRTMAVAICGLSLTIVSVATLLFFRCNQGTQLDRSFGTGGDSCVAACNCDDVYSPVCDVTTNITYRSACHAGCIDMSMWKGMQIYSGCQCLSDLPSTNGTASSSTSGGGNSGILFRGPCQRPDCSQSHLPIFVGVMGTASLTAGLASTPSTLVILHIVPPTEKAFAIGIVFVFTRILAWIPAPVYVGYVIDSACLRWSQIESQDYRDDVTTRDDRRRCEIYDKDRLRKHFFAAAGALLVLSLLFYILALYLETKRIGREKKKEETRILDSEISFGAEKTPEVRTSDYAKEKLAAPETVAICDTSSIRTSESFSEINQLMFPAEESYIDPVGLDTLKLSEKQPVMVSLSTSAPDALVTQVTSLPVTPKPLNVIRATAV